MTGQTSTLYPCPKSRSHLYVHQHPVAVHGRGVDVTVSNPGNCAAQSFLFRGVRQDLDPLKHNVDPEIDADLADGIAQVLE
jgi:hypothetical protein